MAGRKVRPLTPAEAAGRDRAEIEKLNKSGPISVADYTLLNELSLPDLIENTRKIIARIKDE